MGSLPTASFRVKGDWGNGVLYTGGYVVSLPGGSTEIRFDEATKVLSWHLAAPATAGAPRLSADLRARDRMMSSIYKVYGLGSDLQAFWRDLKRWCDRREVRWLWRAAVWGRRALFAMHVASWFV